MAEKADKDKPVNIEADKLTIDDIKKESVFEGNVTLTQGTLTLRRTASWSSRTHRASTTASPTASPPTSSKSARDTTSTSKATPSALEYDGRRDKMQMFVNAEVHKGSDEVKGDYISYDAVTEFYQVIGGPSVTNQVNPKGRVRADHPTPKKTAEKPGRGGATGAAETVRVAAQAGRRMTRLRSSRPPSLPITFTWT